jgi:two-component SAPR family response regulator
VEAFESHLARARQTKDNTKRMEWLQRAVDLVQGPYLNEVEGDWAIEERERLRQIYVSALEELAHLYLDVNEFDRCLSICQFALVQDRYNEGIYRLEMRTYATLGDRASVVRCYQACKEAVKEGLGIPLSQETEELYRDLTA